MNEANRERLEILLKGHEQMMEEKRLRPEGVLRQNDELRDQFNRAARSVIVPVLEEIKDVMVGKVESASIFHRSTAAGLKVKLDRWEDFDRSLRPPKLEDFVNQVQVTEKLGIFIEAARRRGEALDHVLLAGPPGLGKTSLAYIIAAELEVLMVQTAGPALERKADIAAFLSQLPKRRDSTPKPAPVRPVDRAPGDIRKLLEAMGQGAAPGGRSP